MSSRNTLPPVLAPYLRLPPELSLILLTSTLGTSTTWLTSRFVGASLAPAETEQRTAVVLVSWLRDERFWKNEVRRAMGLDTGRLSSTGDFAFIDGLAALAKPSRTPREGDILEHIEKSISTTIDAVSSHDTKNVLLILDAPDALIATATNTTPDLNAFLLRLRSKVHSTIVTLSSDLPLVSSAASPSAPVQSFAQPTPLELATAAFLTQQAHSARFVVSVRELETGAAKDVGGVVRVSRGGDVDADEDGEEVKEMEALFLVGRDGGVKVFERGSVG